MSEDIPEYGTAPEPPVQHEVLVRLKTGDEVTVADANYIDVSDDETILWIYWWDGADEKSKTDRAIFGTGEWSYAMVVKA